MTVNEALASWIETWVWTYLSSPLMFLLVPLVIFLIADRLASTKR